MIHGTFTKLACYSHQSPHFPKHRLGTASMADASRRTLNIKSKKKKKSDVHISTKILLQKIINTTPGQTRPESRQRKKAKTPIKKCTTRSHSIASTGGTAQKQKPKVKIYCLATRQPKLITSHRITKHKSTRANTLSLGTRTKNPKERLKCPIKAA